MVVRGSGFHARHSPAGGGAGPPAVNTIILMHFDGTNGSTTYTDAAGTVTSFATSGTASISTAQSVFGGASLSLASSSYIDGTPSNTALNIGTGEITVECRAYVTAAPSGHVNFCSFQPVSGNTALNLGINASGHLFYYISDNAGTSQLVDGSGSISLNTWHAVAVVRSNPSGFISLFLDGTRTDTPLSFNNNLNYNGILFSVGSNTAVGGTAGPAMYIDELRVSKIARYTGTSYTPASSAFTVD
jgi:Concanavalin A-like lectin/glucanases superfamily